MSEPNERDWAAETEAQVLDEALLLAPEQGWTWTMAYRAAGAAGLSKGEAELLLPEGPRDLVALWSRRCDALALEALAQVDAGALKVRERISRGVEARVAAALSHEAATRRAAGFLALPANAPLGLRLVWESADVIWRWAGDRATDENHYTKRAILSEVLTGTLLIRLAAGEDAAAAHLERRIAQVMAFERWKARVKLGGIGEAAAGVLGRVRYALTP